jgi:hypothetical protein
MKRTTLISAGTLAIAVLWISSCSLMGFGQRDEIQASLAAGALLDYVAAQGLEQVQELDTAGDTYDLGASGGTSAGVRAVTSDTKVWEYPDVTITITRELDDQDTPTPTDDTLTVTRELDYGFEANKVHVLVRPLRPTTDPEWDSYMDGDGSSGWTVDPTDQILQDGTIAILLGDVQLSGGEVEATWARVGDIIFAEQIIKEMSNVVHPNVVHRTIITQTVDGETSLLREREVDGIVVHSFTVEPYVDPDTGETLPRITRDDGGYAIVRARGDRLGGPRIVDYYNAEDLLLMRMEEIRSFPIGTMVSTRTYFGPDGEITGIRTVTYSVNYIEGDEDSVQITRTVNGRTRVVTITESGDVYVVVMNGESYLMRVVDASTVEFLDDAGNVIMIAERSPDGSWQITIGGEVVIV